MRKLPGGWTGEHESNLQPETGYGLVIGIRWGYWNTLEYVSRHNAHTRQLTHAGSPGVVGSCRELLGVAGSCRGLLGVAGKLEVAGKSLGKYGVADGQEKIFKEIGSEAI